MSSNLTGQFRIVSKTDGKDLLFGQSAVYIKEKIKFYSVNGPDTTFYQSAATKYPGSGFDSVLIAFFSPGPGSAIYIKLNDLDTDTLRLSYNSFHTRCCGTITEITKYNYNNIDVVPEQGITKISK